MRLWLLIALVGCKTDETMYPIIPGGPGGPGIGNHDAAVVVDGNDGGAQITGKVCLITDARDLATCAMVNAGGLAVQLGTKSALTAADGSFTIASPQGTNLEWQVTGANVVVTTDTSFSTTTTLPVLTATTYMELESNNGVLDVEGEGSILAQVVHGGAPVTQATAATNPLGANAIFYDGNSVSQWNPSEFTGAHGMVWAPNIAVGGATLTVQPMTGPAQLVAGIPIIDRGITVVTVELP